MTQTFGKGCYASVVLLIGVDYMGKRLQGDNRRLDVLIGAASTRLRLILMTTLTTIGGMIPLLVMQDKTAIWYSLAVGTIGGLSSSMLLTLIVVPVVYARFIGLSTI